MQYALCLNVQKLLSVLIFLRGLEVWFGNHNGFWLRLGLRVQLLRGDFFLCLRIMVRVRVWVGVGVRVRIRVGIRFLTLTQTLRRNEKSPLDM